MLIEFKNLLCNAVAAQHELVALGDLRVGHAAKAVADGAVDPGAGVCLEVGPQFVFFCLAAALPSSRRKMSLMAIIMER
mgnify:CR=1 FL=1